MIISSVHSHGYYRLGIAGFSIFERDTVSIPDTTRQTFLGGLFSSTKKHNESSGNREKHFYICGIPVCVRREGTFGRDLAILKRTIWKKSWPQFIAESSFFKSIEEANHFFFFKVNSGEVFLFLRFMLPNLLKNLPGIRPVLVTTKKYHVDMANILCPDIPCILAKDTILLRLPSASYEVQGKHLHVLFPAAHCSAIEKSLTTTSPEHYFDKAVRFLGLENKLTEHFEIRIPAEVKKSTLIKATSLSLNLDNFVFLAPEAASCRLLSDEFWLHLAKTFHDQGYDIFVNAMQCTELAQKMGKTCHITYPEAFALALQAKRIVSLRSGFTEFLMDTAVPLDVVYTDFERRGALVEVPAHAVLKGFTLSQLPNFNSELVREFIYTPDTEQKILQAILQ